MKRSDTKSMVFRPTYLGLHTMVLLPPLLRKEHIAKIRHVMRQKAIGIIEKVTKIFKLQTILFPFNLRGPNLQIKWMSSNFSFKL